MSKIILAAFTLPLLLLFAPADIHSGNSPANKSPATHGQDGTLQKMIVASGSVIMDLDLNRIERSELPRRWNRDGPLARTLGVVLRRGGEFFLSSSCF